MNAPLFVVLGWAEFVPFDLVDLKYIGAFMTRVAARPAVQAALKAEGPLA
jgi:glutathione S-transferase